MSDLFAKALAESGDDEQAEFLNSFAEHLASVCRDGSKLENQICNISYLVTQRFVKFCSDIVEFNNLHANEFETLGQKLNSNRKRLAKLQNEIADKQKELEALSDSQ